MTQEEYNDDKFNSARKEVSNYEINSERSAGDKDNNLNQFIYNSNEKPKAEEQSTVNKSQRESENEEDLKDDKSIQNFNNSEESENEETEFYQNDFDINNKQNSEENKNTQMKDPVDILFGKSNNSKQVEYLN